MSEPLHIEFTEGGDHFGVSLTNCPHGGGICHIRLPLADGTSAEVCIPREVGGALGVCLTQLAAGAPFEQLTRRH